MTLLSFLSIFLCVGVLQEQTSRANDDSLITVISWKWSKTRRTVEKGTVENTGPMREVIPANKISQRTARVNDPVGVRDPNEDTIDGRSAALEKSVQESRSPSRQTFNGFLYQTKVHNSGKKTIDVLFWEYQIRDSMKPDIVSSRQFLCGVEIRPDKDKDLEGFSLASPSEVVSVDTLANNSNALKEKVVINRVEYSDGTIWQRRDWNFQDIKLSYQRVLKEAWVPGTCKAL